MDESARNGPEIAAFQLSLRDRTFLAQARDRPVSVALCYLPGRGRKLLDELDNGQGYYDFHHINTGLMRLPASRALTAVRHPDLLDLEIVDDTLFYTVRGLLIQLFRVTLFDDLGVFWLGVLNISIGVPKAVIGRGRCAKRTVRR